MDFVVVVDDDDYVNDQGQMLMMMYHYMDKREKMKKILHQLWMDYYQMEVENSKKKRIFV
jgi:hypothetical protein